MKAPYAMLCTGARRKHPAAESSATSMPCRRRSSAGLMRSTGDMLASAEELQLAATPYRRGRAVHVELAIDVLDMRRHGVQRDAEPIADARVGAALREPPQHLHFARGKRGACCRS